MCMGKKPKFMGKTIMGPKISKSARRYVLYAQPDSLRMIKYRLAIQNVAHSLRMIKYRLGIEKKT